MPNYLFNFSAGEVAQGPSRRERAAELLRVQMWGVDAEEPHSGALASGDLTLIYLGAPQRDFIGSAELASAVRDWTPSDAQVYPGDSSGGVLLAGVEEWDPPVPMHAVLPQIDPAASNPYIQANAKAGFHAGVVRITAHEYETVLALRAEGLPSRG
jgi:hypothetical protein